MTTIDNVTGEQIEQLRNESGQYGDERMVTACDMALAYMQSAWEDGLGRQALVRCVEAIQAAEAME